MNNTTIINIFNSDNSNIAYIKTQHGQMMTAIACRILKIESMIKKPIVTNHAFFPVFTFSNSFAYINSIIIQHLWYLIFKKIFVKIICHTFAIGNTTVKFQGKDKEIIWWEI